MMIVALFLVNMVLLTALISKRNNQTNFTFYNCSSLCKVPTGHNLTLPEAVDMAQNRPLWRLLSTSGAIRNFRIAYVRNGRTGHKSVVFNKVKTTKPASLRLSRRSLYPAVTARFMNVERRNGACS